MIYCSDILEWANTYEGPPNHALLSDPPYHLTTGKRGGSGPASENLNSPAGRSRITTGFMNQAWDGGDIAFRPETWDAIGKHLLPGAFMAIFGGSRTFHRLACAIEDAGFIIHPSIGWAQGQGFPKATRIRTGEESDTGETEDLTDIRSGSMHANRDTSKIYTRPVMEAHGMQKVWEGHRYGLQALKPALEFICIAQKPYRGKPIEVITKTGAGALNVNATRVESAGEIVERRGSGGLLSHIRDDKPYPGPKTRYDRNDAILASLGRLPTNFVLTHSIDCQRIGTRTVKEMDTSQRRGRRAVALQDQLDTQARRKPEERSVTLEDVADWVCMEDCPVLALDRQSGPVGAYAP